MFEHGILRLTMVTPNPSRDLGQWQLAGELSAGVHALGQALPARYGLARRRVSAHELLAAMGELLTLLDRLSKANDALMGVAGDDSATQPVLQSRATVLRECFEALACWRRDIDLVRTDRYIERARHALQAAADKVIRELIAAVPGYLLRVQRRAYGTDTVTIEIDIGGELADFQAALEGAGCGCATAGTALAPSGYSPRITQEMDGSTGDCTTIAVMAFLFGWWMGS